jgi:hypothetical protein
MRDRIFVSSPKHPDWFWGAPSLLFTGCGGNKRLGREADHLVTRLRMNGGILLLPFYAFVACMGTTVPLCFNFLCFTSNKLSA